MNSLPVNFRKVDAQPLIKAGETTGYFCEIPHIKFHSLNSTQSNLPKANSISFSINAFSF